MSELTLEELKTKVDKMYEHGKLVRERAADDLVFYWVTQWDDNSLSESDLGFKGEFNILRKSGRQIIGDLKSNPVQVNFTPKSEDDDSGGDLVDGYYRSIDRLNSSIEAYDTAKQETVVAGIGGWELYTEYETNSIGDENQVPRRRPLNEFNNNVFWDESATMMDKSDAYSCAILVPLSKHGMDELAEDLTGVEMSGDTSSFSYPEHSYTFPWISGQDEIYYAVRYYRREKTTDHVLTMTDPSGQELRVLESSIKEIEDELLAEGYNIVESKEITRFKVTLTIANGNRILKTYEIVGENIPVVVAYGERAMVEGTEHYEGVTRLSKDPQRLRNFQMSYLADIVSRSPRPKPIFNPEQITGFESMYEGGGSENNLPYLLMRSKTPDGTPLPIGPVAVLPEQQAPTALMQSIALSREAVNDVAPANLTQDLADIDLSGKALTQLQNRLDEQSIVYQQNFKHALRRDGEIFAGMASKLLDAPRDVTITKPDGTTKTVSIMETILDEETGEMVTLNDITGSTFEVFAEIGPSYTTKREETFDRLDKMIEKAAMVDPKLAQMLVYKQTELMEGINMEDVREWARKQALLAGFTEPETEEDMQLVQQSQQGQQPDANLIAAQAMDKEAQSKIMNSQTSQFKVQNDAQNKDAATKINEFKAQTDRANMQINAEKVGADINFNRIETLTKQMTAINSQSLRGSARLVN